jgi:2',3'-cyclic-nucleotide 2'-phosphodiesterase
VRILYFGDVVGRGGRKAVAEVVRRILARDEADFVVANGENASGGIGIDPGTAREMLASGVDVLTSGNHIWAKRDIYDYLEASDRLLRPANFAPGVPGRGAGVYATKGGVAVAVVNLIGRVFMGPADCPFRAADDALARVGDRARVVLVDMHAEATSEKVAMGRYLDGRVSAVVGSHTHVPTADHDVLPKGTAYVTDTGMCGPIDSVIGMRTDLVVRRFLDQLPVRFEVGSGAIRVNGMRIDVDESTGRARSIERIREDVGSAG